MLKNCIKGFFQRWGVYSFSDGYQKLIAVTLLYTLSLNISSVFISTFFMKQTNDNTVVILYYIVLYIAECITFFTVTYLNKRFSVTLSLRLGLLFISMSFVALLLLQSNAVKYFYIVSILYGVAAAFYGLSHHELTIGLTEPSYRQKAIAVTGTISSTLLIFAPIISGVLLYALPGMAGYLAVFGVSVTGLCVAAVISIKLPNISTKKKSMNVFKAMGNVLKNNVCRWFMVGELFRGLRDGTLMFYLNILLYTFFRGDGVANTGEAILSVNLTIKGIATVLTYYYISKHVQDNQRFGIVLKATLFNLLLTVALGFWLNTGTVFIYCIIDAIVYTFYLNSTQYVAYEVVDYVSREENRRSETLATRSFVVDIGRMLGLLFVLVVPPSTNLVVTVLCILYGTDLIAFAFYCGAWTRMGRSVRFWRREKDGE